MDLPTSFEKTSQKIPTKKTSRQLPKSCLILISNPYLPTKNKLLYLFILCKRNFIIFFLGTKGKFYLFKQTVYDKYIVCYKALSKSAHLTNIPEILSYTKLGQDSYTKILSICNLPILASPLATPLASWYM